MWLYPVIANADLRVSEEIDCFEFDAAAQFPVVHEVGGSHLGEFSSYVFLSACICPFSVGFAPRE